MRNYRIFDGYTMSYQDAPTEEFACMLRTGFQDSKDRDIYEGDILTGERLKGVVEYDESDCRFILRCGREIRSLFGTRDLVVVGNAFEHPNLV